MLPADHPAREAERLRAIIVTLAEAMPDLPVSEAAPIIFKSEQRSAQLESVLLTPSRVYPKFADTTPETGAKFIDLCPAIQEPIIDSKKINGIKEFRALTGWGLKESKEAVELWDKLRTAPPPVAAAAAPRPAYTGAWSSTMIADWIDGQTKIIEWLTGASSPPGSYSGSGKIHAIKEVRATCPGHPGLKEAKDGCEEWLRTRPR